MRAFVFFPLLLSITAAAQASETITYTYDALGRLVAVARSGTVNNGANAAYGYDPANNRTNVTVTGGSGGMAQGRQPAIKKAEQQGAGANGARRK